MNVTRRAFALFIIFFAALWVGSLVCGAAKKPKIEPSYAWRVLPPLGLREPATIDTLYEDYSLNFVPQIVTPARATTGNFAAESTRMVYMDREPIGDWFFHDAVAHWLPSEQSFKWYNTRIPMTLVSYNFGGGKDNGQDAFSTVFSGNVNQKLQIGAMLDYLYSKGSYNYQADKDFTWGFSGSYISNRFDCQAYLWHYNLLTKENGGITDDLYITDPAVVQGGNTSINPKQIPTRLTASHSRVKGGEFYVNSRYKVGFYKEEQVNDSVVNRTLVPVTSFIWTLKYTDRKHRFLSTNPTEIKDFWANTYFDPSRTDDHSTFWSLRNTVGIALLEGFNKWAKAGLSIFGTYEMRKYDLEPDELTINSESASLTPDPFPGMVRKEKENLAWVGAQLTKQQGRLINYDITGELGVLGPAAGEIKVNGEIITRLPLFGDTVGVTAFGKFTNLEAPWLMKHYRSNNFIWDNSFSKTRAFRVGGSLVIPWTNTSLQASVENVQNLIYFNEQALPTQYNGSIQIFSATLRQRFHFKAFNWDNYITYQTSGNQSVVPLPKLVVNSNMYLKFKIATLFVQFGVDVDYFTRYKGVDFQPATMTFYNQNAVDIGNYPFMSVYLNFKLSKTRFYVMMSHVNQGMTGTNYFSMPHYPMNPRRLQMGLSIDFAN